MPNEPEKPEKTGEETPDEQPPTTVTKAPPKAAPAKPSVESVLPEDVELEILSPQPGDVVLARLPLNPTEARVQQVAMALHTVFPENHSMLLPHDLDLQLADENVMREAGWVPIV